LPHWKDLTGYRSGYLEAIAKVEDSGGRGIHTRWWCICHRCGKIVDVESGHLTSTWRPQLSCCLKGSIESSTRKDLTNKIFGCLRADHIVKNGAKGKHVKWACECICGNWTIVDASDLTKGSTLSCGCKTMSKGELAVYNVLKNMNIDFDIQYKLYDLTTKAGGHPRMDFVIYKKNKEVMAFIEYQGELHYIDTGNFGKNIREETDPMKKKYCKEKNIPLYEIKYDENIPQAVTKIMLSLKLIPCQASDGEGVSTIP
jgi:hypothetical protein